MNKLIVYISVLTLLIACAPKEQAEEHHEGEENQTQLTLSDAQLKNINLQTGALSSRVISSTIKLSGKISVPTQNLVTVSAPLGGYLRNTRLQPGMKVNKGEVIAVLEDIQYINLQQEYLTALAQLRLVESEYVRQKELLESKASSIKTVEQAKANFQTQRILIKSLEQKLLLIGINPQQVTTENISKSIRVLAPISGFVSAVKANIGAYINPSDVLFELINPSNLQLMLTAFDKDISKLTIGQKVYASTNENPSKSYSAKIVVINKSLSNENTSEVYCRFDNSNPHLLPGMFMNAVIERSSDQVSALPEDAVVNFQNKSYVFVQVGSKQFEMKEVKIGETENGFVEIKDSISLQGKTLVVNEAYTLLMMLRNTGEGGH